MILLIKLLIEELKDHVPDNLSFQVGYYEAGKQTKRRWLYCAEDLQAMYMFFKPNTEVMLWCDGKDEDSGKTPRKRKQDSSRREEKEEEVESVFLDLKEKHAEYDIPKLRLWARMITSGLHDSTDEPPKVPVFQSTEPKRKKSVIGEAAEAIVSCLSQQRPSTPIQTSPKSIGISPNKVADLRMKHFEQLRYLQTLFEDKIINETELSEQKEKIMEALRNL